MPKIKCPACEYETQDLEVALAAALNTQLAAHIQASHAPHVPNAPQVDPQRRKLKVDPPTIGVDCNPEQWSSFVRLWKMYKASSAIHADSVSTALFYCGSEELRNDILKDIQDDISTMSEDDLLKAMKRLAVIEESTLAQRLKLGKMTQTPGTGIRTFLASLRGQAALCNYTAKCKEQGCNHTYDFSEQIILDNLVRGMSDHEIMSNLLGDSKTDRTLDETVLFIAQKEQGKATQSAVEHQTSLKATSTPPHTRGKAEKQHPKSLSSCWACGGKSHGTRNDRATRSESCPAWAFTCNKCSVKGHYTSCCSKCTTCNNWGHRAGNSRFCRPQAPTQGPPTNGRRQNLSKSTISHNNQVSDTDDLSTGALFDQLCITNISECLSSDTAIPTNPPIKHHIFNGQWFTRNSEPHPTITVTLTPSPADHATLGHPMSQSCSPRPVNVSMIADSGCQSCIMPTTVAYKMGLSDSDIFPVTLTMRGAIAEDLFVCGGIVAIITATDMSGSIRCTKQIIYLSKKMTKSFLCREALVDLGALPTHFPAIPANNIHITASTSSVTEPDLPICSCPKRPDEPPPLPTSLPPGLKAIPEHVPALKQWILDYYGASSFNTCEHQPLRMMQGEPMRLHIDPDAKPLAVHKPALVPIHYQEQVFKDLVRDIRLQVLEKVGTNIPTKWCSRMVIAAKADGKPRRTVDFQHLNRHSVRQTHHVQTPFHLADRVPQNTFKTVTDAWNGYHSVPIHPEDRDPTTFITPWGRYRYRVAPQGFLASGDVYNQKFDAIIAEFPNKVKCVDDTLMWSSSIQDAFFQLCKWCDLTYRGGITLNPRKTQFAEETVDFAGLTVTPTNVRPCSKFIDSIKNFPTPKDISGARAWFGLVNQGSYAFAMAKQMQPFRHLLKPSVKFTWTEELDSIFQQSKDVIINQMKEGVRLFDMSRPTSLCTDWSVDGIGFVLKQKYCDCTPTIPTCCSNGWKLCLVGSRFTTPAESRYSPIEGEALAVVYGLHQTRYYILGCNDLVVATDHKPLIKILNDKPLTEITNRRLLNLKEKTLPYSFTIIHVPGRKNTGPDAASRYPTQEGEPIELPCESQDVSDFCDTADDVSLTSAACSTLHSVTDMVTWNMVREATASDPILQKLMITSQEGFPSQARDLAPDLRPYFRYSDSITCVDGVLLLGERIIIPQSLRPQILSALHSAHQGVNMMIARATDSVFWPNMTTDISTVRDACLHCNRIAKSNPTQPPEDPPHPDFPFQQIACDYFQYMNNDYVVVVDRYSGWPMVYKSEGGANGLVKRLRETFVTFGIPEEITSDGGPQFTAGVTQSFLDAWKVCHRKTSVANPHANSRAEIAVKTVKRLLMDNTGPSGSLNTDNFQRAMLTYRNSIDPETKASPALILFGRPIRDAIPIPLGRYCPHNTWKEILAHRERALAKRHSREHEKWTEHTQLLQPLRVGDHVYIQNLVGNNPKRWERTGVIVEVRQFHQYVVRVDGSGRVTLRNRQHLRKFVPFRPETTSNPVLSTPAARLAQPYATLQTPKPPPVTLQPSVTNDPQGSPSNSSNSPLPAVPPTNSDHTQEPTATTPDPAPQPLVHSMPLQPSVSPEPREKAQPQQIFPKRIPRALSRLLPHNQSGTQELAQPRRVGRS